MRGGSSKTPGTETCVLRKETKHGREKQSCDNKVESGLVEAQHDMLVEKALYNRPVVISDGNGGVVEVSAKQLLN